MSFEGCRVEFSKTNSYIMDRKKKLDKIKSREDKDAVQLFGSYIKTMINVMETGTHDQKKNMFGLEKVYEPNKDVSYLPSGNVRFHYYNGARKETTSRVSDELFSIECDKNWYLMIFEDY